MQPTSYSKIVIENISLSPLIDLYCDWALGTDQFRDKRSSRLKIGIPRDLSLPNLLQGGDFGTKDKCFIRTRLAQTPERWLLHWTHLDNRDDTITWHTFACLENINKGVSVEHLVGRAFSSNRDLRPTWAPPVITRHIVQEFGHKLSEKELFKETATQVKPNEIEDFVSHILLNPKRKAPLVLVTPKNGSGDFLVAPDDLAHGLVGMAAVFYLSTSKACWKFEEALEANGLVKQHGCYDGGIKLYWQGLDKKSTPYDHPLWHRFRLSALPEKNRTSRTIILIGESLAKEVSTHSWLSIIADIDLLQWRESAKALLKDNAALPVPTFQDVEQLNVAIDIRNKRISDLEKKLKDATEFQDFFAAEHKKIDIELQEKNACLRRIEQKLDEHQDLYQLRTPLDAVLLAQNVFAGALIILDSAIKNADRCVYRKPKEVFSVLALLAVSAPIASANPHLVERLLNEIFGNRIGWKPKDSPQTSKKFTRNFVSSTGISKEYKLHITFGHGEKTTANMQIYYDYTSNGLAEIAYVGEHLPTVGVNT